MSLFNKKNKIIYSHFRSNWKLILFFAIFWVILTIGVTFIMNLGNSKWYLAPTAIIEIQPGSTSFTSVQPFSTLLDLIIFSMPSTIFFSIVSIVFSYISINKEIRTGQITIWMTTSLSRKRIIFSKVVFVMLVVTTIYIISLIPLLSLFLKTVDGKDFIWLFLVNIFMFWIFLLLLSSMFSALSILLKEQNSLWIVISSLIVFYIFVSELAIIFSEISPETFGWAKNIQYVSIQSLFESFLKFDEPLYDSGDLKPGMNIFSGKLLPHSPWNYIAPFLNIALISSFLLVSAFVFERQDLKI